MSEKKRRSYTPEEKAKAVEALRSRGKGVSIRQVAVELGYSPHLVTNWLYKSKLRKPRKSKKQKIVVTIKAKGQPTSVVTDAIVFLRHARDAMKVEIVRDNNRIDDPGYLFSMLALNRLEGGQRK